MVGEGKCLMKCGNKIENRNLMNQIFCWNFVFFFFFWLWSKLSAEDFPFPLLLFSFYVCLILFSVFLAPFGSNWMWKSKIIIFPLHRARLKTIAREKICNLWIEWESQKLRVLRGVIEFHMLGLLLWKAHEVPQSFRGNRISVRISGLNSWRS